LSKICYTPKRFNRSSAAIITQANEIIDEYRGQGFDLTLRQLYYQFVARSYIPNKDREYKRLGSIVADARLAGQIDWTAIVDRTRNLRSNPHWEDPADRIRSYASYFTVDKWSDQEYRPEVWIEKDALIGILEAACDPLDVPFFSCRGYTSISEMWEAAQRFQGHKGQKTVVFHLGDHDPSGIDMSRDIQDRLETFGADVEFHRVALNKDQVDKYSPPPNPAKVDDARFKDYEALYGEECWELDALDPVALTALIQERIQAIRDEQKWAAREQEEEEGKQKLVLVAKHWDDVEKFLAKRPKRKGGGK
jgi:hypothetical protein